RAGNGGGPASHTPAPESSTTVASCRTWRGLRIIVAGGETGDGVPVARRRDVERPARRAGPGEPPGRVACGVYRRGAKRVPSGPGRRQGMADSAGRKWRRPCQPHPGTRVFHYRCFLPDLAGFADYRRGGTNRATINKTWRRERDCSAHPGPRPFVLRTAGPPSASEFVPDEFVEPRGL